MSVAVLALNIAETIGLFTVALVVARAERRRRGEQVFRDEMQDGFADVLARLDERAQNAEHEARQARHGIKGLTAAVERSHTGQRLIVDDLLDEIRRERESRERSERDGDGRRVVPDN